MAGEAKKNPITITKAGPWDATRIARLLCEWFAVSAVRWPEPEPASLIQWVMHTIENGYVVLAERDGRLFGVAGIQAVFLPWNLQEPVFRDAFFYVPPAHRKNGVANALIEALKLYCSQRGTPLMMEIISGTKATEKLERWYQIRGGRYCGGVLVFGLTDKPEEPAPKREKELEPWDS